MEKKVAIITGAAGGIGRATAIKLSEAGYNLCLVDIDEESIVKLSKELNTESIVVKCDVRNEEEVKNYVQQTITNFGKINVFVNNAGVEGEVAPITLTESKNIDFVLDVNIKGVYYGLKHVLPIMYEQKNGSVINVSSVAGFIGSPGLCPYIASKHAVIGITKTAALESASFNVRVNAICPGPVDNNMMRNIERKASPEAPDAVLENFKTMIPLGRYASNEEIANAISFFASDEALYITGTTLRVDGGMGAK